MNPRRVKNRGGYESRQTKKRRIRDFFYRLVCLIIGHDEVGVYSWISYCERCYCCFDPTEEEND